VGDLSKVTEALEQYDRSRAALTKAYQTHILSVMRVARRLVRAKNPVRARKIRSALARERALVEKAAPELFYPSPEVSALDSIVEGWKKTDEGA